MAGSDVDNDLAAELMAGYVVHLCPKRMLGSGGSPTGPAETWVQGFHFFLCLEAGPKKCRLLPLYSSGNVGREALSTEGRLGHPKWVHGTFHFHPAQTWTASRAVIARAAADADDRSRKGSRNTLAVEFLPNV